MNGLTKQKEKLTESLQLTVEMTGNLNYKSNKKSIADEICKVALNENLPTLCSDSSFVVQLNKL